MTKNQTNKVKKISMQDLMTGLGINKGNIVVVKDETLICNDKFDLVRLAKSGGGYSSAIPNLILGMVSNKYPYTVYQIYSTIFFNEEVV